MVRCKIVILPISRRTNENFRSFETTISEAWPQIVTKLELFKFRDYQWMWQFIGGYKFQLFKGRLFSVFAYERAESPKLLLPYGKTDSMD